MNTTTVIVVVAVCAIVGIFIWCIFRYLKAKKAQALHDIYSTGNESGSLKSDAPEQETTKDERKSANESMAEPAAKVAANLHRYGDDGESSLVEATTDDTINKKPGPHGKDIPFSEFLKPGLPQRSRVGKTERKKKSEVWVKFREGQSNTETKDKLGQRKREKDALTHGKLTDITMAEPGTMH